MSQPIRMKCPCCGTEGQHPLVHTYPSNRKWPEAEKLFIHLPEGIHFHFRQHDKKCLSDECPEFRTVEMPKRFLDQLINRVQELDLKARCFDTRELPIEQAEFFKQLLEEGMSQKDIAEKTSFTEAHVSTRLTLLKAPSWMLEEVKKGNMKAEKAVAHVRQQERSVN